ncbi:unnamed protein product [Acanthoscelides obtectus]|uniref:Uncharacterized protein n=1 Tax=Acanthoscelides obtectus TaxID=200917 RepID=A0A9P0Q4R6_ACAOB|nr:unnamed protein product [Acanthoscelides obtectus]CAK1664506.1 hypothetical protein AOBTE_LOCUS24298 [Acanthoscelides obtectus]
MKKFKQHGSFKIHNYVDIWLDSLVYVLPGFTSLLHCPFLLMLHPQLACEGGKIVSMKARSSCKYIACARFGRLYANDYIYDVESEKAGKRRRYKYAKVENITL